jgi:hypothetical protein
MGKMILSLSVALLAAYSAGNSAFVSPGMSAPLAFGALVNAAYVVKNFHDLKHRGRI